MNLLNVSNNAKTVKSDSFGDFLTGVLYLAPAKTSGRQTCPNSSVGCRSSCLFTAGRGAMSSVQVGRIRKTNLWFDDRKEFVRLLEQDLTALKKKCEAINVRPAVRLNGTSDIMFCKDELVAKLLNKFPDTQLYDYSKRQSYFKQYMAGQLPKNLYLTFSRSEHNWEFCKHVLDNGFNVSAVFETLPEEYMGYPVFNGDESDLRFLDPFGICGLSAKGKAKKDKTGFVVRGVT
jgi:hypothetical protein